MSDDDTLELSEAEYESLHIGRQKARETLLRAFDIMGIRHEKSGRIPGDGAPYIDVEPEDLSVSSVTRYLAATIDALRSTAFLYYAASRVGGLPGAHMQVALMRMPAVIAWIEFHHKTDYAVRLQQRVDEVMSAPQERAMEAATDLANHLERVAKLIEDTDKRWAPATGIGWHPMTQLQLAEAIGSASTVRNWAEACGIPRRDAQGHPYSNDEVRRIVLHGAEHGKGASKAAAAKIAEGKATQLPSS